MNLQGIAKKQLHQYRMNKLNAENTEKLTDVNVAKSSYYKRQDKFNQNAILESISGIHEAGEQARKIKHVISMVQMKVLIYVRCYHSCISTRKTAMHIFVHVCIYSRESDTNV